MLSALGLLLGLTLFIPACGTGPQADYTAGDLLLEEDFDLGFGWDDGERNGVSIGVDRGAYRIRSDVSQYTRGYGPQTYTDVIIEAEMVQSAADQVNAYGIVCRASPSQSSANGYYFLISSDGAYSIRQGESSGEVTALIPWARSGAIRTGAGVNRMRVICAGDYLALIVNDRLLADRRDSTYASGYIGFAAATRAGTTVEVAFDDLRVWEAVVGD
jgi:hypothetical protein